MLHWLIEPVIPWSVSGRATQRSAGASHKGTLYVDGEFLVFEGLAASVRLPLDGLRLHRNRWIGGPVHFEHRGEPDWRFSTRNLRILRHPELQSDNRFVQRASNCRVHLHWLRFALRWSCVLLLVLFIFYPRMRSAAVQKAIGIVPAHHEIAFGAHVSRALEREAKPVDDPLLRQGVDEIATLLASHLPPQPYQFKVSIVADRTVNACALPGGFIFVNTGLIEHSASAEELAGVLSHEIAHVTRRHALARFAEVFGSVALIRIVAGQDVELPEVGAHGLNLMFRSFSRDHENEADEDAVITLRRAGIDPAAFIGMFERWTKEEASAPPQLKRALALLSTHPTHAERVENLKRLSAITPPERPNHRLTFDYTQFKRRAVEVQGGDNP